MVDQHVAERRGVHGRGDPAADLAGRPVRRHRRPARGPARRSGSSWRSRRPRRVCPDNPDEVLASMGNYVFDAQALAEAVTRDSDMQGSKHDMGGDIVPAFVRRQRGRRLRLQGQPGARRDRPRPRLLARRRDDALLLRRPHGRRVAAAGLQPLQRRLADLHRLRPAAAGQARQGRRRHGAGRRGGAALARGRGVGRAGTPLGAVAGGPRRAGRGRRGLGADERRAGRAPVPSSATRSWTRRSSCRPARRSASTRSSTRKRGFMVEDGLTVLGKGQTFPDV